MTVCFLYKYFPKLSRLQRLFSPLNSNSTGISYVAPEVILHKVYIIVLSSQFNFQFLDVERLVLISLSVQSLTNTISSTMLLMAK